MATAKVPELFFGQAYDWSISSYKNALSLDIERPSLYNCQAFSFQVTASVPALPAAGWPQGCRLFHLKPWVGQVRVTRGYGRSPGSAFKTDLSESAFRGSLDALTTPALGISHCDSLDAEQCISSGNPGTNPAPPPHTTLILAPSLGALIRSRGNMHPLPPRPSGGWAVHLHSNLSLCYEPEQTVPLSSRHE